MMSRYDVESQFRLIIKLMIQRVISFNFLVTVNTVISESAPLTADEMLQ